MGIANASRFDIRASRKGVFTGRFVATGLALVTFSLIGLPSAALTAVVLVSAAVVGMPHGALDVLAGPLLAIRRRSPASVSLFLLLYVAAALATAALWLWVPVMGAALFFAFSWWHFGVGETGVHRDGWTLKRAAQSIALGGIPIAIPLAVHTDRVLPMVRALTFSDRFSIPQLQQIGLLGVALIGAAAFLAWIGWTHQQQRETALLAAVFVACDPAISFAVFFIIWHSWPHTTRVLQRLPRTSQPWAAALVVLTALVPVALGAWLLRNDLGDSAAVPFDRLVQVVFITVGSLTVPHLVVTQLWERRGHHRNGLSPHKRPIVT
jgi:beta-carotene 15,15'-dioxygenase